MLWCPLSGTRKDIIIKGGFVILVFMCFFVLFFFFWGVKDVCGLNLYSGLRKLFYRPPELLKIQ